MSEWKKNIKSTLEKREISPSENAWDSLETKLEESNLSKVNNKVWFSWTVAASFLILISLGILFWNDWNSKKSDSNIISSKNDEIKEKPVKKNALESENTNESAKNDKTFYVKKVIEDTSNKNRKSVNDRKTIIEKKETYYKELRVNVTDILETKKDSFNNNIEEKTYKSLSVDELFAEAVNSVKKDTASFSEIEIDENLLLSQVEDEIYQEKSSGILDELTIQLKNVQIAFSERNQK